jgi:septum formation protein
VCGAVWAPSDDVVRHGRESVATLGPVRLILASTSRYRRELLDRLGVPFEVQAPEVDEQPLMASGQAPVTIASTLGRAKAEAVWRTQRDAFVLGSDQLVDLDGEVLGKPGSEGAAVEQLARMAGRSHRLITAVALFEPSGAVREAVDVHTLTMRALSRAELARYVAADQPLDCAGSYRIESRGIAQFETVRGDDFTAIVGLPLLTVTTLLRAAGFPVP